MQIPMFRLMFGFLLVALLSVSLAPAAAADGAQKASGTQTRLQQRIDFGNAQILGQSIKSGAVYLMHRKKSDIPTMIGVRHDYRIEIKEDFDLGETAITKGDDGSTDGHPLPKNH
jgi:hypothetical protein